MSGLLILQLLINPLSIQLTKTAAQFAKFPLEYYKRKNTGNIQHFEVHCKHTIKEDMSIYCIYNLSSLQRAG